MPRARPVQSDLSLSIVNRRLRSLRCKCATLASATTTSTDQYTKSRIADYARATGKGGEWAEEDPAPLAVFDDPKKLVGRALDRRSVMNMNSCKIVYDVVGAWKNILQAAFPSPPSIAAGCRIQSLTSICAAIVGQSMVGETVKSHDAEHAEMAATQELYEAVPMRFRSWTLISHSLALLLSSRPHNPTLLSCLLDLSLDYRLIQESRSILYSFLSLCVQPASSNMAPPLAHPSHTEFLKDICSRWTRISTLSSPATPPTLADGTSSSPHFSRSTFVEIFVSVLVDAQCHEAWTCKATARLARDLRKSCPYGYAALCSGLMVAMVHVTPAPDDDRPGRLALWLDNLPEQCFSEEDSHTTIMRLICTAEVAGFHIVDTTRLATESPMRMLQSALACTAVRCLGAPASTSSDHMRRSVVALLRLTPSTATLDGVVGACFITASSTAAEFPSSSHALAEVLDEIKQRLQIFANALREQALAKFEMSLWSCALRHFQRLKLSEGSNSHASTAFRQALIDARAAADTLRAADDAEIVRTQPRRPFPHPSSLVLASTQTSGKPARALGSVASVPMHRTMRFQSASSTASPITTPKKPRATAKTRGSRPLHRAKPARLSEPLKADTLLLASLKTVSLKLLEYDPSDDCSEDGDLQITTRPRAKRTARPRAPLSTSESVSGSDWGRAQSVRGTKRRRSDTTPRARRCATADGSDDGGNASPLAKRTRSAATPRARTSHAALRPMNGSGSESDEESGSDWGREHGASMTKVAPSRVRRRRSDDSDSGSDWEHDQQARPRGASGGRGSAPVQHSVGARATSRRRAPKNVTQSLKGSDDASSSSLSPVQFKSLLAQATRRRISLRDEPLSSPRIARRRRRIVLDSEDESGLDEPMRTGDSDSDIEIVMDVPVKARVSNAGDDALDLFKYE